ncbi:MIR motif [Pelomyxa schiedti]|nr:MIR motif [Pelomyxa schiedti]
MTVTRRVVVGVFVGLFLIVGVCRGAKTTTPSDDDDDAAADVVTCGSTIKLRHASTNYRLHSHKVTYGSGSGQQSVTGFPEFDDPNSLWTIHGGKDGSCPRGKQIKNGDVIRLMHAQTKKNLHSHLHQSPLTHQQEVSCYGDNGVGDSGDMWVVETQDKGPWKRSAPIRFKHADTGMYLYATSQAKFGNPIPGQLEVSAVKHSDPNSLWNTAEGFYFPVEK